MQVSYEPKGARPSRVPGKADTPPFFRRSRFKRPTNSAWRRQILCREICYLVILNRAFVAAPVRITCPIQPITWTFKRTFTRPMRPTRPFQVAPQEGMDIEGEEFSRGRCGANAPTCGSNMPRPHSAILIIRSRRRSVVSTCADDDGQGSVRLMQSGPAFAGLVVPASGPDSPYLLTTSRR